MSVFRQVTEAERMRIASNDIFMIDLIYRDLIRIFKSEGENDWIIKEERNLWGKRGQKEKGGNFA